MTQVAQYLCVFGDSLSPDNRIQALEAIAQLPPGSHAWRRNSYAIMQGLAQWTSAWGSADSVRIWSSQHLPSFFLGRYPNIVGYNYEGQSTLATYLGINALGDPVGLALEATSRDLQSLTTNQLVLIAMTLSDHLPERDRLGNLAWLLDDLLGDADLQTGYHPESQGARLLSDFTWALLGHPDKFVRWRAAHLVVDLSRAPGAFIDHLMKNFQDRTGLEYFAPTSAFLWMSAQIWTLLCLRRIAVEDPDTVIRFTPILRDVATSSECGHTPCSERSLVVRFWSIQQRQRDQRSSITTQSR